jgi:hypothetical protein
MHPKPLVSNDVVRWLIIVHIDSWFRKLPQAEVSEKELRDLMLKTQRDSIQVSSHNLSSVSTCVESVLVCMSTDTNA